MKLQFRMGGLRVVDGSRQDDAVADVLVREDAVDHCFLSKREGSLKMSNSFARMDGKPLSL